MVKDIKYIIKRVIIGTLIALALMYFKGGLIGNVYAQTLSTYQGPTVQNMIIDNFTQFYEYDIGQTGIWAMQGPGHLYFNFSIQKVSGSATAPTQMVRGVIVIENDDTKFACSLSSPSINNSTYTTNVYSADCPVNFGAGFRKIDFRFTELQANEVSQFRFSIYPFFTYEQNPNMTVNFDSQGMQNTIAANAAAINTNMNDNTTRIINSNNELKNTMTDSSIDNDKAEGDLSTLNSKLASNNSITQLLTLPITLYRSVLNSVSGACSSFSLGTLYQHQIVLPCINLQNLLGSTLYGIIDILISGLFILSFRKKMVDIFNNMTSLKDRGNEVE